MDEGSNQNASSARKSTRDRGFPLRDMLALMAWLVQPLARQHLHNMCDVIDAQLVK